MSYCKSAHPSSILGQASINSNSRALPPYFPSTEKASSTLIGLPPVFEEPLKPDT